MKKKQIWIIAGALVLILLTTAGITIYSVSQTNKEAEVAVDKSTFGTYSDYEVFQNVPVMSGENINITEAEDVGGGDYIINAENTTLSEYSEYLLLLEENGFKKHVDNGEDGIEGDVYTAHYLKDDLLVVATYFANLEKTMITASANTELSEHLFYDESYVADNAPSAKTTLHSPELYYVGNSYIIQLKNGHFILNDGGNETELPYLLDYLESLVPEGEKPVIDAWFITHSHQDHMGILKGFKNEQRYVNRVYVDSIYFNAPSNEAQKAFDAYDNTKLLTALCTSASIYLKSSDGTTPKIYRTRMGEKYFFNDITVDVIYSQELLNYTEWKTWNASSTVLVYNIEEQKALFSADADWECQLTYMNVFDSSYFNLHVYQAPHHGKNVFNEFANYCSSIRTVIYPTYVLGSNSSENSNMGRTTQNIYLQSLATESLTYGDGTKVLTFPYTIGTAESLPLKEWKYNVTAPTR